MKKVLFFIFAVTLCVAFYSCRDDNFDWDKAHSVGKEVESAYAEHFKEIFGEVSPTQSWDFTQTSGTRAGSLAMPERFGGYSGNSRLGSDSWYNVPSELTTWLDQKLPEQVNNTSKGKPLVFTVPSNGEFDLIPVYQGMAYSYWHMSMGIQPMNGSVASDPVKFWEKNQDMEINVNKINWNRWGGVYHLKNRQNGKYLRWDCKRILVNSSSKGAESNVYDDQLYVSSSNNNFSLTDEIKLSFDVRADVESKVTAALQKDLYNYVRNADKLNFTATTSWKTVSYEGSIYSLIGFKWEDLINLISDNYKTNTIVFNLNENKSANNKFYFKNIKLEYKARNSWSWKTLVDTNELSSDTDLSNIKVKENGGGANDPIMVPYFESAPTEVSKWETLDAVNDNRTKGSDVYSYSKDAGFRFTVVSVKTDKIEKKCLVAFRDRPEDAVFVGVNDDGNFYPIPLNNIASVPDIKTYVNDYYDHYLMIGDWLVYCDDNGNLATQKVTKKSGSTSQLVYPWDVSDLSSIDDAKYKWDFEATTGFAYEQFMVTGENAPSGFNKGIWYNYDQNKTTKAWQSVRLDLGEMSLTKQNNDGSCTFKETRSKGYHFSGLTPGDIVYFFWETMAPYYRCKPVSEGGEGGRILTSLNDQMRIINYDGSTLTGIPSNKVVSIVGCEAGVLGKLDSTKEPDYNDMVFLLVTDEEPKVVDVKNVEEIVEKRYMVEDLGATDDIDFNDMVVDVKQVKKYEITTMSDGKSSKEYKSTTQEVILRAMGGTLDFDFKIGDKVIFTKSKIKDYKTMYKTGMQGGKSTTLDDYDCVLCRATLNGNPWDPSTNNVSFTVYKEGTSTAAGGSGTAGNSEQVNIDNNGIYNISFPVVGDPAPRIIAFPVTKLWRDERHECCNDWLYDREPALWEMPENAPDANKNTHTKSFSEWIKEGSNRSDYLKWVEDKFSTKVKNSMDSWLNKKNVVVEQ